MSVSGEPTPSTNPAHPGGVAPVIAPHPPIVGRIERDVVAVSGPDAATYLQGQLSQDVLSLAVGASAASFVLAPQGKVDGWGRVHRVADDAFEIDVDPGAGAAWHARLRRFLLRTKADIVVEQRVPAIAVRGAVIEGALACVSPRLVGGDLLHASLDGDLTSTPGLPAGVVEATVEHLEALRIRAAIPVWGAEIDGDTIPATLGQWVIDASVSFTKGCYTGQELVARIDSRGGHVPRRLVGLELDGPVPPQSSQVLVDGAEVGAITSSAPIDTGSVALAFIARSANVDDGDLTVTGAGLPTPVRGRISAPEDR